MTTNILNHPGELFLGSDHETAVLLGARRFRSAANAVRFAVEHAAPVSLRGAMLRIGDQTFAGHQILALHRDLTRAMPGH